MFGTTKNRIFKNDRTYYYDLIIMYHSTLPFAGSRIKYIIFRLCQNDPIHIGLKTVHEATLDLKLIIKMTML